ncbi:hypothetical protein D921_02676 [Enterococcus faecalis F01966]|nr:hypothetical protein D921_02676 [Enterococcus faecalis F01966]
MSGFSYKKIRVYQYTLIFDLVTNFFSLSFQTNVSSGMTAN